MLAYCTYCSRNKNQSNKPLEAVKLYNSDRITSLFETAEAKNFKFVILSGKYGIVDADQKIDYYDHLLIPSEVEEHSKLIANQLKEKQITYVVFFIGSIEEDENILPYVTCMVKACNKLGILLRIETIK